MIAVLEVAAVSKRFGGIRAVDGVSFAMKPGEIFGIIGPNGAGKTTLFNVITGAMAPSAGKIAFRGADITGRPMDEVARRGVIRTFQSTSVFKRETVAENLRRSHLFARLSRPSSLLDRARVSAVNQAAQARAASVLAFIGFAGSPHALAGDLPYGLQKILGVGMALAAEPKLLLMDEPAAGLNPHETERMGELILRMRKELGIEIMLVEHDMKMVMNVCSRVLVLNYGEPIAIGAPDEIKKNPSVIEAYLGTDYEFA